MKTNKIMKEISFLSLLALGLLTACTTIPTNAKVTTSSTPTDNLSYESSYGYTNTESTISDDYSTTDNSSYSESSGEMEETNDVICLDDNDNETPCPLEEVCTDELDNEVSCESTEVYEDTNTLEQTEPEEMTEEFGCHDEFDNEIPCN